MRQSLLSIAAVGFIVLFSSNVVAGEGCASKKGHKGMSADAIQKFKKDHAWSITEDGAHADKSESNKDAVEDKAPAKSDNDLIGA